MADRIQVRRDTLADWTSNDPTLSSGEVGYVTDTGEAVVGDGSTAFTSLGRFRVDGGSGARQVVAYTASGTFTKASYPWLRAVRIRVAGGGGGGGGAAATTVSTASGGGSGGGGEYREHFTTDIAGLAASVAVTVGAGGVGGGASGTGTANPGGDGGTSSFGSLVTAGGGGGGDGSLGEAPPRMAPAAGGAGGSVGTGGYLRVKGSDGDPAVLFASRMSPARSGGNPLAPERSAGVTTTGAAGSNGELYGGGGSGAINTASQAARAGGDGAAGVVLLELYA